MSVAATTLPAVTRAGTQHPASTRSSGEEWSWCFVDELAMIIPEVTGVTRIPPSPMLF